MSGYFIQLIEPHVLHNLNAIIDLVTTLVYWCKRSFGNMHIPYSGIWRAIFLANALIFTFSKLCIWRIAWNYDAVIALIDKWMMEAFTIRNKVWWITTFMNVMLMERFGCPLASNTDPQTHQLWKRDSQCRGPIRSGTQLLQILPVRTARTPPLAIYVNIRPG